MLIFRRAVRAGGKASRRASCLFSLHSLPFARSLALCDAAFIASVRSFFRFNYPADVALGTNGTLFVADLHSLRRISMPENPTNVLGVGFDGRVSTAAGGAEPGEADGTGPEVCMPC